MFLRPASPSSIAALNFFGDGGVEFPPFHAFERMLMIESVGGGQVKGQCGRVVLAFVVEEEVEFVPRRGF